MTLAERFDSRSNSINALRLILAGMVLVSHSLTLTGHVDPIGYYTGGVVDLGTIAVDGFFALSGFLIAASYVRASSTWRFLWHRCLRILPGFWVCLLVTAAIVLPVAQLLTYGSMQGFPLTGEDSVLGYAWRNSLLYIDQYQVRGLMDGRAVNGSLYTLFYEFMCYLGIAMIGVVGLLGRRTWVLVGAAVVLWSLALVDLIAAGTLTEGNVVVWLFLRLGGMFLAGTLVFLSAGRIRTHRTLTMCAAALLTAGVVAASMQGSDPHSRLTYLLIAPPAVAYLVIVLGCSALLARVGRRRDLSYGVYVYAWPVQMLLIMAGGNGWPFPLYLLACAVGAGLAAWASWTMVESRALSAKSWTPPARWPRRRAAASA